MMVFVIEMEEINPLLTDPRCYPDLKIFYMIHNETDLKIFYMIQTI